MIKTLLFRGYCIREAVGGIGVAVGGIIVAVAGIGVVVGGIIVAVGGIVVAVSGKVFDVGVDMTELASSAGSVWYIFLSVFSSELISVFSKVLSEFKFEDITS